MQIPHCCQRYQRLQPRLATGTCHQEYCSLDLGASTDASQHTQNRKGSHYAGFSVQTAATIFTTRHRQEALSTWQTHLLQRHERCGTHPSQALCKFNAVAIHNPTSLLRVRLIPTTSGRRMDMLHGNQAQKCKHRAKTAGSIGYV